MANVAAIVGVAGAAIGFLLAAFSLGISRAPFWGERRQFALVAASAAAYCGFDVALVVHLPPAAIATSVQIALAFSVVHGVAWIRYLAAADRRPLRTVERVTVMTGAVIALAGLVPGLLVTRDLFPVTIGWLGITYRTPKPTVAGIACYGYMCATLVVIAAGSRHRWREGWQARLPLIGVSMLALLAVNDTLSSAGVLQMPLLLDIGSVVLVSIVAVIHERRFAANVHDLERASAELKSEVATRTDALLRAQAELAASERLVGLGRLTAGVAHEINNPIAVVQHSLERLKESRGAGRHDAGEARYVENALAATHRIVRVVRRLLDAGRVGSAAGAVHVGPFHVASVVRQALTMVERFVQDVDVSVDVEESLTALGDAGFVAQVLENLLVNAAHALEERPAGRRIRVTASRAADRVRIAVADNGPGVPAAVRHLLFEPFVSTKAVGKGSGLGLAVSLGLMRSQSGDLELTRTSGAGTEMCLSLPWTPLAPPADAAPPEPPARVEDVALLIIDDDEDVRESSSTSRPWRRSTTPAGW